MPGFFVMLLAIQENILPTLPPAIKYSANKFTNLISFTLICINGLLIILQTHLINLSTYRITRAAE